MKFGYSYKTSDGIRHEDIFEAKSNDAVFAALREKGIRPIKVWEIRSRYYVSHRTRVIILLSLALAAALSYILLRAPQPTSGDSRTAPRHQIYGDPTIWEELERDDFAAVFPERGDRVLALYAIPGRAVPQAQTPQLPFRERVAALAAVKDRDVEFADGEPAEAAELKRIVQGMKEELRWYVADGVGTVETYLQRLRERQDEEIRIYERTRKELENCTDNALREERNAALRAMGIRTIPRPRPVEE